jgi:hypothetical protein
MERRRGEAHQRDLWFRQGSAAGVVILIAAGLPGEGESDDEVRLGMASSRVVVVASIVSRRGARAWLEGGGSAVVAG